MGPRWPHSPFAMSTLPLVEFVRTRPGEDPFILGSQRYQFVTVRNATGAIDIGVYCFSTDLCYDYLAWRKANCLP